MPERIAVCNRLHEHKNVTAPDDGPRGTRLPIDACGKGEQARGGERAPELALTNCHG